MGVTNFDNLPQNIVASKIREARQAQRELKGSSQRAAGANVRYFRTNGAAPFAWSGRVDTQSSQSSTTGFARFVVTLTAAHASTFLSRLVAEYYSSTDGTTWTPVTLTGTPFSPPPLQVRPLTGLLVEPYETRFLVVLTDTYNSYRAFTLQALATDEVGISVERVL